ncbi:MAG: hypothetical protein WC700_11845 [Gemmatimonadaceae bacterium]|jgi:hypothetical protein
MQKSVAAFAALTILIAAPADAQKGLFFGAHVTGASLTNGTESDPVDFGSGTGLHAGLSFGKAFGLLVNHDRSILGAKSDNLDLGQWDVLGRMSFIDVGPATAYLTAGFSKRASNAFDDDGRSTFFKSTNLTAGVTGQLLATSKIAVDAGFLRTLGSFSDGQGHDASRIDRIVLGISYYLFGGGRTAPGNRLRGF